MDSTQQKEATSHSGEPSSSTSPAASLETKVLRSSARVKAAKQKEKAKDRVPVEHQPLSPSPPSKRTRESTNAKGKGREVADEPSRAGKRCVHAFGICLESVLNIVPHLRARRSTYPVSPTLTINEPAKDTKGKKRAAPEDNSDDEAVNSISAPVKRTRTISSYSLRSRDTTTPNEMPKKSRYHSLYLLRLL